MEDIYSVTFRVASTDVDAQNYLRPAAVLTWFQHYGTEHGAILHMDRDYLVENYHACWILARVWFRFLRPVTEGETVTLKTWCRGAGGLIVYRDFDIFSGDELVGEGISAWVIADLDTRTMLRPGTVENLAVYCAPECCKDRQLKLIRRPTNCYSVYNREVRYSDLDINGHMNNTRYADVIMDAFRPDRLSGKFVKEFQLNYSVECKFSDELEISLANTDSGFYVDGRTNDGRRYFEAKILFEDFEDCVK